MKTTLSPPCLVCIALGLSASLLAAQAPRPQDDLFLYANHQWLRDTPIPDDRVTYSAAAELVDRVERQLRTIIEDLQATPEAALGTEGRLVVDLYRSVVDREALNRAGLAPIREDLARFAAVASLKEASALAGRLSVTSEGGPFDVTLAAAGRRANRTVARVAVGGLLLPDWSYYLSPSPETLSIRRAYATYLTRIFEASGQSRREAEDGAGAVIAFETAIAAAIRGAGNPPASPRVWSISEIERAMPGFVWREWAKPQGLDQAAGLMLDQPEFFRAFSSAFGRTSPVALSAWLRARFLTSLAPYLPDEFSNARFEFFGTRLTGQVAPREPWKRGVSMVGEFLAMRSDAGTWRRIFLRRRVIGCARWCRRCWRPRASLSGSRPGWPRRIGRPISVGSPPSKPKSATPISGGCMRGSRWTRVTCWGTSAACGSSTCATACSAPAWRVRPWSG